MKLLPKPNESPDNDDVSAALHLLGESLQAEVQRINSEGSQAMQVGDYDTAQSVIDFAKRLTAFRTKVSDLGAEWLKLEDHRDKASVEVQQIVSKRFFGKSKKGQITPHLDYCRPLLEVLVEIGGSGKTKQVLDLLGEKMKSILKPKDYEPHESVETPIHGNATYILHREWLALCQRSKYELIKNPDVTRIIHHNMTDWRYDVCRALKVKPPSNSNDY